MPMTRWPLAALLAAPLLLLATTAALAEERVERLTWALSIGDVQVGTRTATITLEQRGRTTLRSIDAMTKVSGTIAGRSLSWTQRLTAFADEGPAAFHAVMDEDGRAREVQGRWAIGGWTVSAVDKAGPRTMQAAPHRIDLSTVDLFDPRAVVRLGDLQTAKLLSAETGDVWEGTVTALGGSTVAIRGQEVAVQGFSWASPAGASSFWYDAEGWLVRFEMTVVGRRIQGVLTAPPPASPDSFVLDVGGGGVDAQDL